MPLAGSAHRPAQGTCLGWLRTSCPCHRSQAHHCWLVPCMSEGGGSARAWWQVTIPPSLLGGGGGGHAMSQYIMHGQTCKVSDGAIDISTRIILACLTTTCGIRCTLVIFHKWVGIHNEHVICQLTLEQSIVCTNQEVEPESGMFN